MLTVLLPTRDRPDHCTRQLEFLRGNRFPHRIIVLDASEPDAASRLRDACRGLAEYRHFDRSYRMADKLAATVGQVATPFVMLVPDDDVILPHAIEAELEFLGEHPDFVVAHGYFLSFAPRDAEIDITGVIGFTPSIADDDPLRRHYDLFRRYQSFYWGVFRTPVFAVAVSGATAMPVVLFRELTVMSRTIVQGKVARLPLIHALRGVAPSHAAFHDSNALVWALRDAGGFFEAYRAYRDAVVSFIRGRGVGDPPGGSLQQFLDVSHLSWLGREIDLGPINHTAQQLLGDPLPSPCWAAPSAAAQAPLVSDEIALSPDGSRRYIWRRAALQAEPRAEISISREERERVERQLDAYPLARPAMPASVEKRSP